MRAPLSRRNASSRGVDLSTDGDSHAQQLRHFVSAPGTYLETTLITRRLLGEYEVGAKGTRESGATGRGGQPDRPPYLTEPLLTP